MRQKPFFIIIAVLYAVACSMAPVLGKKASAKLMDGVYEGGYSSFPNSAIVRVTIAGNRITEIALVEHRASSWGKKAEDIIPKRIVEKQSTHVDAVSGATNSSRVIMNAAEEALKKAMVENKGSANPGD